jgi:uncharacterized membrane-anchored protein
MGGKDHAMISSKKFVIAALALPIICLAGLAVHKASVRQTGQEITLNITGYDPRDLLSGHYLIYNIDYQTPDLCATDMQSERSVYVCPEQGILHVDSQPRGCTVFIAGRCEGRRFIAGVERFYIPQEHALPLERLVIDKRGSVVLSVSASGKAQVKELLIEGQPWFDYLTSHTEK